MRAFSPSLLAYFAALSASGICLVDSAAIPRSQGDAVSLDDSTLAAKSNSHVVIFNDGGRPRWGFVIPKGKRSAKMAPPTMPVPPKLAKAGHTKSKGKAKSDKNQGEKPKIADDKKSSKPSAPHPSSASRPSSAHHTHPKHVPGSHHRDSHKGGKKGGRNVLERRMKINKGHSIVTVALSNGRFGHKYETNAVMWRASPSAQDSEKDRRSPNRAHARDLASHRRRHPRHGSRHRAVHDIKGTYHIHSGAADIAIPIANDVKYAVVPQHAAHIPDNGKHHTRDTISADVPGTIDIKTTSDLQIKLASLVLSIDPTTNASFVMNANNNTATPVYLHVIPGATAPPDANGSPVKVVSLRIPVFDRTQATEAEYCAQFDAMPTAPVPLTAEPCLDNSASPANLTDPPSHASQSFAYMPSTGAITPIWLNSTTPTPSVANSTSMTAVKRSDDCDDDDTSDTATQFNAVNGTSSQINDTTNVISGPPQAVGVMMYFEPLVSAQIYSVALASDGSSTTASAGGSAAANGGGSDDFEGPGDDPGYEDTDTESSDASDENSVGGNVDSNASVSASPPSADTPATSSAPTAPTGTPPQRIPSSPNTSNLTSSSAHSPPSASSPPASTPSATAGSPIIQANVVSASQTPPNSTQHNTPSPAAITVTMSPTPSSTSCSTSNATHASPSSDRTASNSPAADASASYEWLFTPDGS